MTFSSHKRLLRPALISVMALLCFPASAGEIYKTVDENGKVSYSDSAPSKTAKPVDLPKINTQPAIKTPSKVFDPSSIKDPEIRYFLDIISPEDETYLHNGQRVLDVNVRLSPGLPQGAYFQAKLNGVAHGQSTRSSRITLRDIHRGQQNLSVALMDSAGNTIVETEVVRLYVQRPSLNSPQRKNKNN